MDPQIKWWQFIPHGTFLALMAGAGKLGRDWVKGVNKKIANKADVSTVKEVEQKKIDAAMFDAHRISVEQRLTELAVRLERQDTDSDQKHRDNSSKLDAIHRRVDNILLALTTGRGIQR